MPTTVGSESGGLTRVNGPNTRWGRLSAFAASASDSPDRTRFRYSSAFGFARCFFFSILSVCSTDGLIWASGGTPAGWRLSRRKM